MAAKTRKFFFIVSLLLLSGKAKGRETYPQALANRVIPTLRGFQQRSEFFKDLTGLDEPAFRRAISWSSKGASGLSSYFGATVDDVRKALFLNITTVPPTASCSRVFSDFNQSRSSRLDELYTKINKRLNDPLRFFNKSDKECSLFQGELFYGSVKQFKEIAEAIKKQTKADAVERPKFVLLLHDTTQPWRADITALVSDPRYKYATFQVASAPFGLLEGGKSPKNNSFMGNGYYSIENVYAQGEIISTACAAGMIARKYLFDTGDLELFGTWQNKALVIQNPQNNNKALLFNAETMPLALTASDASELYTEINGGLHHNIVVSNGFSTDFFQDKEGLFPYLSQLSLFTQQVYDKNSRRKKNIFSAFANILDGVVQTVNHVLVSAFDLRSYPQSEDYFPANDADGKHWIAQAAKNILKGDYYITHYAAYSANYLTEQIMTEIIERYPIAIRDSPAFRRFIPDTWRRPLFLTLVGGGSFLYHPNWIAQTLTGPDFVKCMQEYPLEVVLVFRPDKNRPNQPRNPTTDADFIKKMAMLANTINQEKKLIGLEFERALNLYLEISYMYEDKKAKLIEALKPSVPSQEQLETIWQRIEEEIQKISIGEEKKAGSKRSWLKNIKGSSAKEVLFEARLWLENWFGSAEYGVVLEEGEINIARYMMSEKPPQEKNEEPPQEKKWFSTPEWLKKLKTRFIHIFRYS